MSKYTLKDLEMPDDEPMVIIRSSHLWICDGDKYAAAALNMYVHWTRWLMKRKPVAKEINNMLKKKGKVPSQDTSYIIYRRQSYLVDDMLGFCSEKRLRQANDLLKSKGLLTIDDTPRNISDHILKYELQIGTFKTLMDAWRKQRDGNNELDEDDMDEVSLEADLDGTDNLPLRDGKKTAPSSSRDGKLSASEREKDRLNRNIDNSLIDDTHRNISSSTASEPEIEENNNDNDSLISKSSLEEEKAIWASICSAKGVKKNPTHKERGQITELAELIHSNNLPIEEFTATFISDMWQHALDTKPYLREDPEWKVGNIITELPDYLVVRQRAIPRVATEPGVATFRADTVDYLRESAKLQDCSEEEAIAEAQKRYEQSAMSADQFDSVVVQSAMNAATRTQRDGGNWLQYFTSIMDKKLNKQLATA